MLKKEAEELGKEIIKESNGKIKLRFLDNNGYGSCYIKNLPEDLKEAHEENMMEVEDEDIPVISSLKAEIDEFILNVKLGLESIAGVKPLLAKIEQELKI